MKCLSEIIMLFLCNFIANMLNFIIYICYNDSKLGFLNFLASLKNYIMLYVT
jgi:hypothetical protein